MADALYCLALHYLDNPIIRHERIAYYAERVWLY